MSRSIRSAIRKRADSAYKSAQVSPSKLNSPMVRRAAGIGKSYKKFKEQG